MFSILDDVKPFDRILDKDIPIGYYSVRTGVMLPTKGNDWHSHEMIRFCLSVGLITLLDITYVVKPSLSLKSEYFHKFLDYFSEKAGEEGKMGANGFIGMFGHKIDKKKKIYLTKSLNYSSYLYFTRNNVTISPHKDFYEVDIRKQAYIEDSYVPIFNQILDLEAIEFSKITKLIEKHNGMVSYVNTDNAVGEFEYWDLHNFKAEAKNHFWDKEIKF